MMGGVADNSLPKIYIARKKYVYTGNTAACLPCLIMRRNIKMQLSTIDCFWYFFHCDSLSEQETKINKLINCKPRIKINTEYKWICIEKKGEIFFKVLKDRRPT